MGTELKNGFDACTGCNLCVLPCPVYRRTHDVMLTMHGRMRALQAQATAEDLNESLDACLFCGACEAVCPENIDLIPIARGLREENVKAGRSSLSKADIVMMQLSPGKKLLEQAKVRNALGPRDLLVIDARPYNTDFKRQVIFYDRLKKETGCQLNIDLQRVAIPTGASSLQALEGVQGLELEKQTAWLLEGRDYDRIVVENPLDGDILARVSGKEVVHLRELG